MALLIAVFGVAAQDTVTAQTTTTTLTVTPLMIGLPTASNTWICAKCAGDHAKFTINVVDTDPNFKGNGNDIIRVTVKNLELGTLGTVVTPDSNPKEITLIEVDADGNGNADEGEFQRVVTAVNKTAGLVSDKVPANTLAATVVTVTTGTVDGSTADTLSDIAVTDSLSAADQAAVIGGTVRIVTGLSANNVRTATGFVAETGVVTVDRAWDGGSLDSADTYQLFPMVNVPAFTGQTISVTYSKAGSLGQTKSIMNDEVKPTVIVASPAQDFITKKAETILFQADITDTNSGFPSSSSATTGMLRNVTEGRKIGTIKLFVGTQQVALDASNFTAIDNGWRLAASFSSTDISAIATKVPWWIIATDMAGNTQEPSEGIERTSSAAGDTDGTTIVDSSMANMAATSLVGRTVTVTVNGVDQTRTVDAYTAGTGTLTFNGDHSGGSADKFTTTTAITGTASAAGTTTTLLDTALSGRSATDLVGATVTVPTGAAAANETLAITAYVDGAPAATITFAAATNATTLAMAYTINPMAAVSLTGTATAGTTTTLGDTALTAKTGGTLIGGKLTVPTGADGASESRAITAYVDTSGAGTVTVAPALTSAPTAGMAYTIKKAAGVGKQIAATTKYTIKKTLLITVDGVKPDVAAVVTGDNWDTSKGAGLRLRQTTATTANGKSTSIRVTFTDESGLDPATVVPSAFTVESNTVSAALVVDIVGENAATPEQRVPLDVFLTVGTALASSAKPSVTVATTVADKATNTCCAATSVRKATDRLGPGMTVALDNTLSKKQVKATITSDELLVAAPTAAVQVMTNVTTGVVGTIAATTGGANAGAVAQTGSLVYTQTTKIASLGANAGAEFNLYVTGNDTGANNGNLGKKGHATDATKTTAITFELDQWLNMGNPPKVDVAGTLAEATTASATGVPKLEAVDPIIVTIDFNVGCTAGDACAAAGEVNEYVGDSHKTVTLTKATLKVTFKDGTSETTTYNVATDLTSPDNKRFTLPVQAPKVGKYLLTIQAVDEAGNDNLKSPTAVTPQSMTYNWEVTAASAVKLSLSPGWNLLSLPFNPANPAINSVIPATHPIDLIMTYDSTDQVWLVSRRNTTTGLFEGDVTVMTATTAYFARTNNFETLDLLQPPVATQAAAPPPPPAISVKVGWNLVPVVTFTPSTTKGIAANSYFGTLGITWLKAMTYNPLTRTWVSITPGDTFTVAFGATNPCTGKALVAANVLAQTEPCQNAAPVAGAGGGTAFDEATDTVTMKRAVIMGSGYWLYVNKDGVIIP